MKNYKNVTSYYGFILLDSRNTPHRYSHLALWGKAKEQVGKKVTSVQGTLLLRILVTSSSSLFTLQTVIGRASLKTKNTQKTTVLH